MKALRIGVLTGVLSMAAMPAHAAVIGLLGGDYDPDPINSGLVYSGGSCAAVNNELDTSHFTNFQCVFYDFADLNGDTSLDAIHSIEALISGFVGEEVFTVDEFSELPFLGGDTLVPGSLRLSGGNIVPNFNVGCEIECPPLVTGLALYVGPSEGETLPQLTFQTVAVNEQVTVPEPATIMLLGPGVLAALFAKKRLARKTGRA